MIFPGVNGCLFTAGDTTRWRGTCLSLLSHPEIGSSFGAVRGNYVCQARSWEKNVGVYTRLYRSLLAAQANFPGSAPYDEGRLLARVLPGRVSLSYLSGSVARSRASRTCARSCAHSRRSRIHLSHHLCHNEREGDCGEARNATALDYPVEQLEIIVVSDASSDRTDDIVRRAQARDPRIRLLRPG